MSKRIITLTALFFALCAASFSAGAGPQFTVALQGYDAVAYFEGASPQKGEFMHSVQWNGTNWLFANDERAKRFKENPSKYAPQFDGHCALAASRGYIAPGDALTGVVVDGKLYVNFNEQAKQIWDEDRPGNIRKGVANWPKLLKQTEQPVAHRSVDVDGLSIFYREAGSPEAPAVLLLHGFPSSSFMYRNLMPSLAGRYRVIAPDYPGFGQSAFPPASRYSYTFEQLARTMDRFTEVVGARRYALYIQDYGAPIGLRMALAHPERVTALIVQNGNAYAEGLSSGWDPLRAYWQAPTPQNREGLRGWLTAEGIRQQYVAGVPEHLLGRFSPDTWTLDWELLQRPGNIDMQLDLFGDYQHNVALYPRFQQLFRERQFPTLIVWGKHDVFFTVAGAEAYRRDLPKAQLQLLDAGHFALETHAPEVATAILGFLARQ